MCMQVARLPEVQQVPRSLRLRSTFTLVAAAFEELPRVAVPTEGAAVDPCVQWDELIESLTCRRALSPNATTPGSRLRECARAAHSESVWRSHPP